MPQHFQLPVRALQAIALSMQQSRQHFILQCAPYKLKIKRAFYASIYLHTCITYALVELRKLRNQNFAATKRARNNCQVLLNGCRNCFNITLKIRKYSIALQNHFSRTVDSKSDCEISQKEICESNFKKEHKDTHVQI